MTADDLSWKSVQALQAELEQLRAAADRDVRAIDPGLPANLLRKVLEEHKKKHARIDTLENELRYRNVKVR